MTSARQMLRAAVQGGASPQDAATELERSMGVQIDAEHVTAMIAGRSTIQSAPREAPRAVRPPPLVKPTEFSEEAAPETAPQQ